MGKNSRRRRGKSRDRSSPFSEDYNYSRKRSSHYDPLCYRSENRLGNIKKRHKSSKLNKKEDYDHRFGDFFSKKKFSKNSSYSESPVKSGRRSKFDQFYQENILKPKTEKSCSRLILSKSISPLPHRNRAVIDTKIPFVPVVQLNKRWKSDSGNQTTVYSLSDFESDFKRFRDIDPSIKEGYEYERINLERYNKTLHNIKDNSLKENICRRSTHRSPVMYRERRDSLGEGNSDLPKSSYNGFFPASEGSSSEFRMKQISGILSRSYKYERCQASNPIAYKRTLQYMEERQLSSYDNSIDDTICDPITKCILNRNVIFRTFEHVNNAIDTHSSCIFTIKCYNILSQSAAMNHPEMYTHLAITKDDGGVEMDKLLLEDERYNKLLSELTTYTTDILCLQECDQYFYDNILKPAMEKIDFKGEFLLKCFPDSTDGCAMFYSNKFKLLNKKDIHFSEFIAGHDKKPQVGQILEFEVNSGDDRCPEDKTHLFVANTHILYNPKRGDLKLSQVVCLMAHLQDMVKNCKNPSAYIMCGDFNMQPYSKMYNFIVDGKCETTFDRATFSGQISSKSIETIRHINNKIIRGSLVDHNCKLVDKSGGHYYGPITHELSFASVYKHYTGKQKKPEISTYHTCDASNPDFIFYGVAVRAVDKSVVFVDETPNLSLLKRLSLPSDCEIARNLGPMPNSYTGSDHLPLVAQFQLR
uniref:Protein angel (inferred by orthology to a D. melanogaster protein) n=1 Tax=Strongyloides venezuelensis TaxID=75913 RepID=A0A0K0F1J8_STRVS